MTTFQGAYVNYQAFNWVSDDSSIANFVFFTEMWIVLMTEYNFEVLQIWDSKWDPG